MWIILYVLYIILNEQIQSSAGPRVLFQLKQMLIMGVRWGWGVSKCMLHLGASQGTLCVCVCDYVCVCVCVCIDYSCLSCDV